MKLTKMKRITAEDIIGIQCDCSGKDIPPETGYWHVDPSDTDYCTDDCLISEFFNYVNRSSSDANSGNMMEFNIKRTYHHFRERKRKR